MVARSDRHVNARACWAPPSRRPRRRTRVGGTVRPVAVSLRASAGSLPAAEVGADAADTREAGAANDPLIGRSEGAERSRAGSGGRVIWICRARPPSSQLLTPVGMRSLGNPCSPSACADSTRRLTGLYRLSERFRRESDFLRCAAAVEFVRRSTTVRSGARCFLSRAMRSGTRPFRAGP